MSEDPGSVPERREREVEWSRVCGDQSLELGAPGEPAPWEVDADPGSES